MTRSTTYQDIVDKINDVSGGKLQARILNVGGDKPNQIMLQSGSTGATQTIKIFKRHCWRFRQAWLG
ncbi:hypothetical protein VBZ67_06500 [Campylobacter concisus]